MELFQLIINKVADVLICFQIQVFKIQIMSIDPVCHGYFIEGPNEKAEVI